METPSGPQIAASLPFLYAFLCRVEADPRAMATYYIGNPWFDCAPLPLASVATKHFHCSALVLSYILLSFSSPRKSTSAIARWVLSVIARNRFKETAPPSSSDSPSATSLSGEDASPLLAVPNGLVSHNEGDTMKVLVGGQKCGP